MLNRIIIMRFHVLLAVFILPVAIMFFVTGCFYTWGIKGGYETIIQNIDLTKPLQKELVSLVVVVSDELEKQSISLPTGKAKIKQIGNSFQLEWTGSDKDVVLEATANPHIAQLKIKKTSPYRYFVQLHKAKGGILFKIYAAFLAIALICLFISGFIMAWQMPKLRQMLLTSMSLGLVMFSTMILLS